MGKTKYDAKVILELVEQGLTSTEIARKLGCSQTPVVNAKRAAGIKVRNTRARKTYTEYQKICMCNEFKKLKETISARSASVKLGIDQSTLLRWCRDFGIDHASNAIKVQYVRTSKEERAVICDNIEKLRTSGLSLTEACDRLNVSRSSVRNWKILKN